MAETLFLGLILASLVVIIARAFIMDRKSPDE